MLQLGKEESTDIVPAAARVRVYLRSQGSVMQAVKGLFMEKWFCWVSMGVSALLLLLFLLDLFLNFPFSGISKPVDVIVILSCGVVFYLAWDAFRDLR